eukprot:6700555-Pyramimonas_sp.AAC.1
MHVSWSGLQAIRSCTVYVQVTWRNLCGVTGWATKGSNITLRIRNANMMRTWRDGGIDDDDDGGADDAIDVGGHDDDGHDVGGHDDGGHDDDGHDVGGHGVADCADDVGGHDGDYD